MRLVHRARMEGGDLVVREVGRDEGLRRVEILQHLHLADVDTATLQLPDVFGPVFADGRQDRRLPAQQAQVVGDVGCASARFPLEARRQEGHVQHVDPVRQDVILEVPFEHHDGVEGNRAADQHASGHGWIPLGRGK
jgi:hypothetical protein